MKSKLTEIFNQVELNQSFKVPASKEGSLETTRKRVEESTGKKFKTKTIKYKEVTRTR